MGRSEGETERLIQQSQLYEAVTRPVVGPLRLFALCIAVERLHFFFLLRQNLKNFYIRRLLCCEIFSM